jgi:lipopolysaccharide/colanic/teichoic acid biosynthesis glycosyltransferase
MCAGGRGLLMLSEAAMIAEGPRMPATGEESPFHVRADWYCTGKRLLDLIVSGILLVPALPLMMLAVIMVKLTSRGPVIYTQTRVGRSGREFVIFKIRTMRHDCEKLTGPRWADRGRDPRVTRVGNFLRKTHLDDLPQLYNVFRGDMTLVGPRPERPEFVAQLEQAIPCYRARLDIRPGVTGLAQLLLPPDVDLHSVRVKLMYDLYYLQKPGFVIDLKLIACTALKVISVPPHISRCLLSVPHEQVIVAAYEARIRDESNIFSRNDLEEVRASGLSMAMERSEIERTEMGVQPAY